MIEGFSARDETAMRSVLAEDLTAYVTNGEGGVDPVHGRDAYLSRLLTLQAPRLEVEITQIVTVAPDQVLVMVEVRAERNERQLHNFAAFLATIVDEQVAELWMVEALPAYSDEFWR